MCGFIGFFSDSVALTETQIVSALKAIEHRGPDGKGIFKDKGNSRVLGHTRLSIIDLQTGGQPLFNEDQSIVAVVNGELYGYQTIRSELQKKGHRFATESDSEILIHLYEEYGAQAIHRLRGEFAFVLYDRKAELLFVGRDRFGIKPLFYSKKNGSYYFASEIKAILAMGVEARWDEDALLQALFLNSCENSQTFFKGIEQVPPAHYALITKNSLKLVPYWDFNYPTADSLLATKNEPDLIEEFRSTLTEAIKLRLHADVPVGCYLSGGLDSCSVLGIASKLSSKPITAFTLGFDDADYDESKIAEEMARKAGASFQLFPMKASELGHHFEDAVWNAEVLMINPHGVAKYLLSKAVHAAGFKVVLTGEGSDEILGGYVHFRRDMLLYNNTGQNHEIIEPLIKQLIETNKVSQGLLLTDSEATGIEKVKNTLGFVPSWIEAFSVNSKAYREIASDRLHELTQHRDGYRKFLDGLPLKQQLFGRDPLNQSLYLWSKLLLPNYLLTVLGDRMEMANSVEGRVPFLDHRVVEAATRLPIHLKINGMNEKYALREAAKDVLTDTVYKRQKHPFLAPPITFNENNSLHQLLQDTLRSSELSHLPLVNREKVVAYLDNLKKLPVAEQAVADPILTSVLSAEILRKRFKISA